MAKKTKRQSFWQQKVSWEMILPAIILMLVVFFGLLVTNPDLFGANFLRGFRRPTHSAATPVPFGNLKISLSSSVSSHEIIKESQDAELVAFDFTNNTRNPLIVKELTLSGYIAEGLGTGTFELGSVGIGPSYVQISHVVSQLQLELRNAEGTITSSAPETLSDIGLATFDNLNFGIPAKTTRTVFVLGDIGTEFSYSPLIAVDIADADQDIKLKPVLPRKIQPTSTRNRPQAVKNPRPVVSVSPRIMGDHPNGGTDPHVYMTMLQSASISVHSAYDIQSELAIAGDQDILTAGYRFIAGGEDFHIQKLTLEQHAGSGSSCVDSIRNVRIKFPTSLEHPGVLDGSAIGYFDEVRRYHFTDLDFRVAEEYNTTLEVYIDTYGPEDESEPGCVNRLYFDGDSSSEFFAVGIDTGLEYTHQDVYSASSPQTILYKTLPTFATNYTGSWVPHSINTDDNHDIYAFDVTADEAGHISLYKITFEIRTEGILETGLGYGHLDEIGGIKIHEIGSGGTVIWYPVGSGTWSAETNRVTVPFTSEAVIAAGTTKHFMVRAPITIDPTAQEVSISTRIYHDYTSAYDGMTQARQVNGNIVWSDRSIDPYSHSFYSYDWTNGYAMNSLPTSHFYLSDTVTSEPVQITFEGPVSQTYSVGDRDVSVFDFDIHTADLPISVEKLQFEITVDPSDPMADDDDLLNCTQYAGNFSDIKIVQTVVGSGTSTVMGPEELTVVSACAASTDDMQQNVTFTGPFVISGGVTKHLRLTLDILDDSDLSGDSVSVTLLDPSQNAIFDYGSGIPVEVQPASDIHGNPMEIKASTLTLSRAATPADDTFTAGTLDAPLVGLSFAAGEASAIIVTSLTLTGFIDEDGTGGYTLGEDNGIPIQSVVGNLKLYDSAGDLISPLPEGFDSSGSASFGGLNWGIPAGTTQKLSVKGDISTSAPYNDTNEMIAIDIDNYYGSTYAHVTAVDETWDIVHVAGPWPNCGGGACIAPATNQTDITVAEGGTLTFSQGLPEPQDEIAIAGEQNVFVARYNVVATQENFEIKKLSLEQDSSYTTCGDVSIQDVIIKYPTQYSSPGVLNGTAEAVMSSGQAHFDLAPPPPTPTAIFPFRVPKDSEIVNFEVYVNTYDTAPSGCKLQLNFNGGSTSRFEAIGYDSSVTLDHSDIASVHPPNDVTLYENIPTAETVHDALWWTSSYLVSGGDEGVYAFEITAVSPEHPISLHKITFEMNPTGLDTSATVTGLGVTNGVKLYRVESGIPRSAIGQGTWDSGEVSVTMFSEEQIAAGSSSQYLLTANVYIDPQAVSVNLNTRFKEDPFEATQGPAASVAAGHNFVWSDTSAAEHTVYTPDWMSGYRVHNLEFDPGITLSP